MKNQCGNLNSSNSISQYVLAKQLSSNPTHGQTMHLTDDMVINIQLLYNSNAPIKSELWNGNFYPISLHIFIEYLAPDSKNIKDFLNFIAKYISNKQVNSLKSNDLEDFYSISEAVWNFISSVY